MIILIYNCIIIKPAFVLSFKKKLWSSKNLRQKDFDIRAEFGSSFGKVFQFCMNTRM